MASDKTKTELVLHVWPGNWGLPTCFPDGLAAILYAQLTIPGEFIVEECTNPDLSPDGQLPYLTDGLACIASLSSIIKYISGIRGRHAEDEEAGLDDNGSLSPTDLSASLDSIEKAKETAWATYASAHLGDLVACSYFALRHNYTKCMRDTLAQALSVPQRYFVPNRIRESYKPRLNAAGLWTVHTEEVEEERRRRGGVAAQTVVTDAFWREKVIEKANTSLSLLSNLLGDRQFFLAKDHPTKLDVIVAAHILLLTSPPLPNDMLRNLVTSSYPSLHAHARRIFARTIPAQTSSLESSLSLSHSFDLVEAESRLINSAPPIQTRTSSSGLIQSLRSLINPPQSSVSVSRITEKTEEEKKEEREFTMMRWAWFAAAGGALLWAASGFSLVIVRLGNQQGVEDTGSGTSTMEEEEDTTEEESESDGPDDGEPGE